MKILLAPINKFSHESKLALILKHLNWEIVSHDPDINFWITDGKQPDPLYYNWRLVAMDKCVVNDVFDLVFGYPVEVDPEIYNGLAVQKRLNHGTHGTVIRCPTTYQGEMAYQKLLTNRTDGFTDELRIDVFLSELLISLKHQVVNNRGMPQVERTVGSTEFDVPLASVLTLDELQKVVSFCAEIGLDYGGLDAIRHVDGKLYIIDATANVGMPRMEWHQNLTLEKYLSREAELFERNFSRCNQK
jgi:hypothetical protein